MICRTSPNLKTVQSKSKTKIHELLSFYILFRKKYNSIFNTDWMDKMRLSIQCSNNLTLSSSTDKNKDCFCHLECALQCLKKKRHNRSFLGRMSTGNKKQSRDCGYVFWKGTFQKFKAPATGRWKQTLLILEI